MGKRNNTLLLAVAISAVLVLAYLACSQYFKPETTELQMSLTVGGRIGFDINTTALTFGTVPPGGASSRDVIVENKDAYDKTASFSAEGSISRFVKLPPNIRIKAFSNATASVRAEVPANAEPGNYTGRLLIHLRRAI
ncbi:MAG: hypothetical protein QXD77_02215 [Candidatus Aenigmatarchaeota archaeon]